MQEVLSKAEGKIPLKEQEFYELKLQDVIAKLGTRYCVRQAHAEWSEIDGQITWDSEESDYWILEEAKKRYAERRKALVEKGFIYSDMDL